MTNTLYQTSNNLAQGAGESVLDVNKIIQEIIPSTNPVSALAQSLTAGFTSGTVYAVSNFLYGVANAINDSPTDCGCQLGPCGNAIAEAKRETSAGDYGAQASCNEARKTCGAYYSSADINKMAPGCAKVRQSGHLSVVIMDRLTPLLHAPYSTLKSPTMHRAILPSM